MRVLDTRAVARALIGGLYIHIFRSCPTSFFWNKVDFIRSQSGRTWIYEYTPPPPPISVLATALLDTYLLLALYWNFFIMVVFHTRRKQELNLINSPLKFNQHEVDKSRGRDMQIFTVVKQLRSWLNNPVWGLYTASLTLHTEKLQWAS